ncbi:MAG: hypothetical protein V4505_13270 [Pseudomonadota bacterium]
MTTIRRGFLRGTLCAALLGALAACAVGPPPAQPLLTPQQIDGIVAGRSAADRAADERRKPAAMLAFIGMRPGMVVLDISAAGGYTTELLARAAGPTGKVYGQSPPRKPAGGPAPAVPEGGMAMPAAAPPMAARPAPRPSPVALADRDALLRSSNAGAAPIVPVVQPFDNPVPPALADGSLDLATLMLNYHDFGFMGVDRAGMNQAVFRALKPGGMYVIADHAGRPGTGISESGTLHRVEDALVIREVEAAGFRLQARGEFLRNPRDPRDRNVPVPPQPKDDFVLKFVKP